jgi:hypothetical protein
MERGKRIELSALAWKAKVLPLYEPRINIFMYTYDATTKSGLMIHLSMKENSDCYILVYDVFTQQLTMKFFTDVDSAKEFIHSL